MRRTRLAVGLAVVLMLVGSAASASAFTGSALPGIPALGAVSGENMQAVANAPNLAGNGLDLFERLDVNGNARRYAVAAAHGNGFDIVDITDPPAPETVSHYATPGLNYHPWVQVNPRRQIVAVSIEDPGVSPAHGVSNGIEFVDIADLANPTRLGVASGLGGPHTIRMIGDNHVYTTLPTHIIDYTDPRSPVNLGEFQCGHEFYEDPNIPGHTYVGFCGNSRWGVLDTSDPAKPVIISETRDLDVAFAHEVFPSPDSSFVGVADFRSGLSHTQCPGGGIHFYDISGYYVDGASLASPKKMGTWFIPFNGAGVDPDSTGTNWGPCTTHSWQFQPERMLVTAGMYTGGTWVMDPTRPPGSGEWSGTPDRGLGPTTWGSTLGNFVAEGDFVNATQWLPFDVEPGAERFVVTNGLVRGLDVLEYTGDLPQKVARLTADGSGGVITGVLDRYAVLTHDGWENKPLEGKELTVTADGVSATVVTGPDGSFSTSLTLPPGTHEVVVQWPGDEAYLPATATVVVSV